MSEIHRETVSEPNLCYYTQPITIMFILKALRYQSENLGNLFSARSMIEISVR
jgi:hypothetical protein